jgi:hypothetical protein
MAMRWNSELRKYGKAILSTLVLIAGGISLQAAEVSLAWDAPTNNIDGTPLTDVAGYRIYHGFQSGNYSDFTNVVNVTTARVTNLQLGLTNYFTVTALNRAGNESDYSAELVVFRPVEPPAPIDSDANGLPDAWEIAHFGELRVLGMTPQDDSDHDGSLNIAEYMAGTDPTDSQSRPKLQINQVGDQIQVSFTAVQATGIGYEGTTRVYSLQRCDDLGAGAWIDVPSVSTVLAQNQVVSYNADTLASGGGFYRFLVQLQ